MFIFLIAVASFLSSGVAVYASHKAVTANRAAAQYALIALNHKTEAEEQSGFAQRAALGAATHSRLAFFHAASAENTVQMSVQTSAPATIDAGTFEIPSEVSPEMPRKSRRELVAEAARSPENEARVARINEYRAQTSVLIPGNNPLAQTDVAEFRKRHNRFK